MIDGVDGENFRKALRELRRQQNLPEGDDLDQATWDALKAEETTDILTTYTLTDKDAAYPFAPTPKDYAELAKLKMIGFRTAGGDDRRALSHG